MADRAETDFGDERHHAFVVGAAPLLADLVHEWRERIDAGLPGDYERAAADLREVYERLTGSEMT